MAQVIGDRYQVGDVLGRGGMAEVRRGIDLRLNRPVAIKTLSGQLAADPVAHQRFRREALAAASLNHPAIAAVFDTGETADATTGSVLPYIVMELVEGQTLRDVIRSGVRLNPTRALELAHGVLDALAHSHTAGIIHRDIKPANVMLTPAGSVKVMDFGIARAATDTSTSLTQTASVIGTAAYLSPEQARGEKVDLRTDIYSTGCLLYELLTGRPPFTGESSISVAYQQVNDPPVPPSQVVAGLSPAVDAVTLRALAKDPNERYQSAAEMIADLDRVLAGGAPAAAPATPLPQAALPTREATTVAAAVADPATVTLPVQAAPGPSTPPRRALPQVHPVPAEPPLRPAAPPEDPPGRGLRRGLIAALVFVLLAVIVLLGFRSLGGSPGLGASAGPSSASAATDSGSSAEPDSAKIPSGLVGSDVDAAKKQLKDAGFTDVRTKKVDAQAGSAKGEVVSVDPEEGTTTALGDRVTLSYARSDFESKAPTTAPPPATSTSPTTSESTESDPPSSREPSESTSAKPSKTATKSATAKPTDSKSSPG